LFERIQGSKARKPNGIGGKKNERLAVRDKEKLASNPLAARLNGSTKTSRRATNVKSRVEKKPTAPHPNILKDNPLFQHISGIVPKQRQQNRKGTSPGAGNILKGANKQEDNSRLNSNSRKYQQLSLSSSRDKNQERRFIGMAAGTDKFPDISKQLIQGQRTFTIKNAAQPPIVHISNLDLGTSAGDVRAVLQSIGEIVDSRATELAESVSAEVVFANPEHAEVAVRELHNSVADGRQISAVISRTHTIPPLSRGNSRRQQAIRQ
jgi:hypothetical protein